MPLFEFGSGRTAEIYENFSNQTMLIITREGKLTFVTGYSSCKDDCLFAVENDRKFVFTDEFSPYEGELEAEWQIGSLTVALEEQFGLPKSPRPKPKHTEFTPTKMNAQSSPAKWSISTAGQLLKQGSERPRR